MDTTEMADISIPIQFFGDYSETSGLLQVESSRRDKVTRCEKIGQLCAYIPICTLHHFVDVAI